MRKFVFSWFVFVAVVSASNLFAQEEEKKRGKGRGPPPVAFRVCAAASEGDSCSYTGRRGTDLTGSCRAYGERGLVCYPDVEMPDQADGKQTVKKQ